MKKLYKLEQLEELKEIYAKEVMESMREVIITINENYGADRNVDSVGNLNNSLVHPREVFKPVILRVPLK